MALIALLLGSNLLAQEMSATPQRTHDTLPFEAARGKGGPIIEMRLNDRPVKALLDTGSAASLVSERLASQLGGKQEPFILPDGTPFVLFPNGPPAEFIRMEKIQFGKFSANRLPLIVAPNERSGFVKSLGCDIVLGLNFLAHYPVMLDFERHEVTLWYPGPLTDPELIMMGYLPANSVPIVSGSRIRVKLNGEVDQNIKIDTRAVQLLGR